MKYRYGHFLALGIAVGALILPPMAIRVYAHNSDAMLSPVGVVLDGQETPSQNPFGSIDLALSATVTVSSAQTGSSASALNDGNIAGYPEDPSHEWASNGEKSGAWAKLEWQAPQTINRIDLYDRPNIDDQVLSGRIDFSDGSSVVFGSLNNDGLNPKIVTFAPKNVTWAKITVTGVTETTANAGFSEVAVYNVSQSAVTAKKLSFRVTAVAPNVFHIVASPPDAPPAPESPFVVQSLPDPSASVTRDASGATVVKASRATLTLGAAGQLSLLDRTGKSLLRSGTILADDGAVTLAVSHNSSERFYGAGNEARSVAGDLLHPSGDSLVSNGVTRVPFLWSTGGWSIFVANNQTGISWGDDQGKMTWTVPGPYADFYIGVAPDAYGLLAAYSRLTGLAPIPPKWTFGYMISRWGYDGVQDVQDKWQQFRDRQIPVDAFIYDYDWFQNDWTFNPKTISPEGLAKMHDMGLHFVGIRKPRVNGVNLAYAAKQGWTLKSQLGTDLRFDLPLASYWWWCHHIPLVKAGVDGWWNDEAEQSGDEFFNMVKTEWNGWRAMSDKRCWTISRAFAPGMQRYGAAVWTGDIASDWQTLANQPGTMLNWSLAGMPYDSQDIGGFLATPTPELYTRWIEEGVFVPVMRSHGTFDSPRWPWAFGSEQEADMKKAIDLRYRLIPYIYTYAAETASTGAPIMRPLFLEFPTDQKTFDMEDEWLFGSRILAAPVLNEGGVRDVYLPAGKWYDFNTNELVNGGQTLHVNAPLDTIPSYVRAGSIVPLGPVIQATALGAEDPLEVRIYPGANASFTLYEDDGATYAYQKGASSRIPFSWDDASRTLTVGARVGSFPGMLSTRHLDVVLPDGSKKSVTYTGLSVNVRF